MSEWESKPIYTIKSDAATLSDLHACIDAAQSSGASGGMFIAVYGDTFDMWGTSGLTGQTRMWIYQALALWELQNDE